MLAAAVIIFFFVVPIALALVTGVIVVRLGVLLGGAVVGIAYLFLAGPAGGPLFGVPLIIGFMAGALWSAVVSR